MKKFILVLIIIGLFITATPAATVGKYIKQGSQVFIGEEGLDINVAMGSYDSIGYWSSGADISQSAPIKMILVSDRKSNFDITTSEFASYLGNWYRIDANNKANGVAFSVVFPQIDIYIINKDTKDSINNGKIANGTNIQFRIGTNTYTVANRNITPESTTDNGFVNIKVYTSNGATYTKLIGSDISLENIYVNSSQYYWDGVWIADTRTYNADTYTIYAENTLNGIDHSNTITSSSAVLYIVSDVVSMSLSQSSIIRSQPFIAHIAGSPNTKHYIWVTKTNTMNETKLSPPQIKSYQENVEVGSTDCANHLIGTTSIPIKDDTPITTFNNPYYASVTTDASGSAIVMFSTSIDTLAKKYTIRVENAKNGLKYAESDINVANGGITMTVQDGANHFIGETITLSGTNSESTSTYLYIYGPNLNMEGAQIASQNPRNDSVINDDVSTFKQATSEGDGTWKWDWKTSDIALNLGTYIIYAVSLPKSRTHLSDTSYTTASITFGKPSLTAAIDFKTISKGDLAYISGIAEGDPKTLAIWIMGVNYVLREFTPVNSNSEFSYEIERDVTRSLSTGQYFVVVQHPMQNGKFDIVLNDNNGTITNLMQGNNGTQLFQFGGLGGLQGTDAANALIKAIDSQYIDDIYTKLQFVITEPYISISEIGLKYPGDKVAITGKTNLKVTNTLIVDIKPLTFKPTDKTDAAMFTSGAIISTPVVFGEDHNTFTTFVDTSTFKPDEYLVTVSCVGETIVDTTTFIISDETRPTIKQNISETTTPTIKSVSTTIPTVTPFPASPPTPVSTTKPLPGYSAVMALLGVLIVGFIVARRK